MDVTSEFLVKNNVYIHHEIITKTRLRRDIWIWGRLVSLGPRDQPYSTAVQKFGIWFFQRIDKSNSVE